MPLKLFKSPLGWFTLALPEDWDEYDGEEEGTSTFFNSKSWSGNLRVSAIQLERNKNVVEFLQNRFTERRDASQFKLGDKSCISYKEYSEQDGEQNTLYWWLTGKENIIFLCSFTINPELELNEEKEQTLNTVLEIVKSIDVRLKIL
jgi:hypothetical protein